MDELTERERTFRLIEELLLSSLPYYEPLDPELEKLIQGGDDNASLC